MCSLVPLLPGQDTLAQLEARARELKSRGDAAGSLAAWEKAAALDPKSAAIQDEIGFLLAVLNRRQEAIQHFERAIALDPRSALAHYHLGVAYWIEQDPDRSIPQLQSRRRRSIPRTSITASIWATL